MNLRFRGKSELEVWHPYSLCLDASSLCYEDGYVTCGSVGGKEVDNSTQDSGVSLLPHQLRQQAHWPLPKYLVVLQSVNTSTLS